MEILVWGGFIGLIILFVMLDLGVFHRRCHVPRIREALGWTAIWVALALAFNVFVYFLYAENWLGWTDHASHALTGRQAAMQYFLGYVLEKSLSIDNLFVIAMVFSYFGIPGEHQHRVLLWGILGAILLRGMMIGLGSLLLSTFSWMVYVFGALLIVSAAKMWMIQNETVDPDRNLLVRLCRLIFPVVSEASPNRFFVIRPDGRRAATSLFLSLLIVESSDVVFAVDSIPAIFAVTRDPFLVFTSNIFAILGLRALYFALSGMMIKFRYLKTSLVFLLAYIGIKMLVSHHYQIANGVSLMIIGAILSVGVVASVMAERKSTDQSELPAGKERDP